MEFCSGKKRNEGMPLAGAVTVSIPPSYGVEDMESRVTYLWACGEQDGRYGSTSRTFQETALGGTREKNGGEYVHMMASVVNLTDPRISWETGL